MNYVPVLSLPATHDQNRSTSAVTSQAGLNWVKTAATDPARQATTLAEDYPPSWMEDVVYEVQDESTQVELAVLKRLARAIAQLPRSTPRPQVGVGDDGSVAMEWDIGPIHMGIQVDPDERFDTAFLDVSRGEDDSVSEARLSAVIGNIYRFFVACAEAGA